MRPLARAAVGLVVFSLVLAGCAKKPPPVVEVSGVVLLDGQPLPKAKVEFVPQLSGFGADKNSSAVTDDQGRFTLMYNFGKEPGAVACTHRVLVTEYMPPEFHRADSQAQQGLAEYQSKLKNRPIPEKYGNIAKTIEVEVTPDKKDYKIELSRK